MDPGSTRGGVGGAMDSDYGSVGAADRHRFTGSGDG